MDGNTWSGIALVISALLLPVVTRYSSGGVAAKEDAAQALARAIAAEAETKRERVSGQRWYNLLMQFHASLKAERHARLSDRQVMGMFPGAPKIDWPPLDPIPDIQDVIQDSNATLPPAE